MPTKRTRLDRRRKPQITDEALSLFVRCRKLQPIYSSCDRVCKSRDESRHCPECLEYLNASRDLHSVLGRHPAQEFVERTIGEDSLPGWMDDQRCIASYKEAVLIRRELERLADEKASA